MAHTLKTYNKTYKGLAEMIAVHLVENDELLVELNTTLRTTLTDDHFALALLTQIISLNTLAIFRGEELITLLSLHNK